MRHCKHCGVSATECARRYNETGQLCCDKCEARDLPLPKRKKK